MEEDCRPLECNHSKSKEDYYSKPMLNGHNKMMKVETNASYNTWSATWNYNNRDTRTPSSHFIILKF